MLAPIRIPVRFCGSPSIIQPLQVAPNQKFLVGNILVQPTDCLSVVNILNPNNSALKLPRNFPIARIHAADLASLPSDKPTAPLSPVINTPSLDAETRTKTLRELGITMDTSQLTPDQADSLTELIYQNRNLFATNMSQLPGTDLVEHHIETTGSPSFQRQYRHSPVVRKEIERQTQHVSKHGIIPESSSVWSHPVILVSKRNDACPRFVVDLRALNRQTVRTCYPLPSLDSVIDTTADHHPVFFSALDLFSGYFQVPLSSQSRDKTAFTTSSGSYCFNRMAFGLSGACQTFQRLMHTVFRHALNQHVLCYLDDVLIFSRSFPEHLTHLQRVFDKLRNANLRLNPRNVNGR